MNRLLGVVAALTVMAAALAALTLTFAPAIAGPRHTCHGYVNYPARHLMSDLRGGAISQSLPRCRLDKP